MADIINPLFTTQALDPERPSFQYKVLTAIGKKREKQLRWKISVIAQRELGNANLPVTEFAVEGWVDQFSKGCPDVEALILSRFVETPPNATPIEDLYWSDKLTDEFIDSVTGNFTKSSVMSLLMAYQGMNSELQEQIAALKTANSQSASSETSSSTDEPSEQSKDTAEMEKPLSESPEQASA